MLFLGQRFFRTKYTCPPEGKSNEYIFNVWIHDFLKYMFFLFLMTSCLGIQKDEFFKEIWPEKWTGENFFFQICIFDAVFLGRDFRTKFGPELFFQTTLEICVLEICENSSFFIVDEIVF